MANNPIIKIKRGSGVPTPSNPAGTAGITAGEFAFNKTGNILYIGACGGYTGYDGVNSFGGIVPGATTLNIIPIGMQISNDPNMGSGGGLNDFVGYSDFTVPTTRAVRDWVNLTKMNQVLGATFRAGPGIGITSDQDAGSTQYDVTISNTGVIKGFTGFNIIGNAFGDAVKAKSAIDGITFIGGAGIALRSSNAAGSLLIQNYGVTSIGGFTGTINTFSPIHSLDGFSADIGVLLRSAVSVDGVITTSIVDTPGTTGIQLSHANSGVAASNHVAYLNNTPQLLDLGFNVYGHITSYTTKALDFNNGLPLNFAQAVQDAAYPGITNFYGPNNYGIDYVYDDNNNRLKTINRGITSLSATGQSGLSGAVLLAVGPGYGSPPIPQLSVAQTKNNNTITYEYIGMQYKSFVVTPVSSTPYANNGGIYLGGVKGANSTILTAANAIANLNVVPGRGIGISMGIMSGNDTMLIWNAGVNRISAYNSNSTLLGATGYSGNLEIRAGTNIELTRTGEDNVLTINSTAGGGGGAVSSIHGTYNTATPPVANSASGVTGNINVIGQDGLITKQNTGVSTKNGDLYIGLASQVKIPAVTNPVDLGIGYQILEIATIRESGIPQASPDIDYLDTPTEYSKLITDVVEGGFTGTFTAAGHGIDSGWREGSFAPDNYTQFDGSNTTPGRILILRAREGTLDRSTGFDPSMAGLHAEIRLLGFPNPETMSGYINEVYDFTAYPDGCPGGQCNQYPPSLPLCTLDHLPYNYTKDLGNRENLKGTAVFHADIVARDSIFVQKDIWLTGELIDATTGCLYAAGNNTTSVFNGGNLGLTGDLVVNGSIYVHGGTAFFNVADLSTESPLLRIGGISASTGYSDQMNSVNSSTTINKYGDRGLLLFSFNPTPYGAMGVGGVPTQLIAVRPVTNFIGIDQDDGVFKYIIEATTVATSQGIFEHTIINSGRLGPARFSEINNVGITADANAVISLKAAITNNPSSNTTGIDLKGFAAITGPTTSSANKANITLANSAKVQLGVVDGVGITFNRSIEFDSGSSESAANALKIRYQGTGDGSAIRNISIRTPATNNYTQLVDVGRSPAADSNYAGGNELAQQTIYNKTLADGTIIDCGTY